MRWRFFDPNNPFEATERNLVIAKIDLWWSEFQRKKADINALFSQKSQWDLAEWMAEHLQVIHPQLMWEFGPAVTGTGHRLVITPESNHHLCPLVQNILQRAPTISGWEFYAYRLAENLESAWHSVQGRTGIDLSNFKVQVSQGNHQTIDLCYSSPDVADEEDAAAFHAAFVATESLLGEEFLYQRIGAIEVLPEGREAKQGRFNELNRLKETAYALSTSMREQLPLEPCYAWQAEASWTLWELEPEKAEDYCGQQDLIVGRSCHPVQWQAARSGRPFSSERFSRFKETFCYLKLDGAEGLGAEGFSDKAEIEDALDALLMPEKLGCQIGGGTGLRYAYIDLALTDVDGALGVIRTRLQQGKVPRRSWILFNDSEWNAEWVVIYDDTPPPPLEFEEQD